METDRSWHRHNVPGARELRVRETPAETVLWHALRNRRFEDLKFRRQHPIGPFVVDFYCSDSRLVIELDGDVHETQRDQDAEREAILTAAGYQIVRFSNEQVFADLPGLLATIRNAAAQVRHDHPRNTPRTGA